MAGSIYCGQCGKRIVEKGKRCICSTHGDVSGNKLRVKMMYQGERIEKRFASLVEAQRFLNGVRFKADEGTLDSRDYKHDNPLGFENLVQQWLELKHGQIKKHSWDSLNNTMRKAIGVWGNRNVKEIGYAEIEDFLFKTLKVLTTKSRANAKSVLHSFFNWLRLRRVLVGHQLPDLPETPYELAFRETISKSQQEAILSVLRDISKDVNPRIWIAVKFLATYFSIRPSELLNIKEGDIDRQNGFIVIPHPKEKRPKVVPLIDEDLALVQSMPISFSTLPFFRHFKGHGGSVPGAQFGPRYLYRWWKRACDNVGVRGVDLYGGTRHSSVIHLGQFFTPEELKQASFHSTNKAFERYYRMKPNVIKNIYEANSPNLSGGRHNSGTLSMPILTKRNKQFPRLTGGGGGS